MFRRSVYVVTWFHRVEGFLGGVSVFKSEKRAMNLYRSIVEDSADDRDDFDFVPRINYQPFADRAWR